MRALVPVANEICLQENRTAPQLPNDLMHALVRPILSGICRTDQEILRGYASHTGVLGHEFVGEVVECHDRDWQGARVVCEINWACQQCNWCLAGGSSKHCPNRKAMGIRNWDGCFSDLVLCPVSNLHRVPDSVTDRQAVFCEPLAAACAVVDCLLSPLSFPGEILGIGDGKLGLLIAQALKAHGYPVRWCCKRESSRTRLASWGIESCLQTPPGRYAYIVEASGSESGLKLAQQHLLARGSLILKSTTDAARPIDLNALVVNEWRILGSRCGNFQTALRLLENRKVDVESLIQDCFSLEQATQAFAAASTPGALKILFQ